MKRVRSFLSCALLLVSAAVTAAAAEHRRVDARPDRNAMWQAMLTKQQTLAVSVAFDGEGRLWRARVQDGHVLVDRSDNEGASFGAPVTVNPDKEVVAAEGDRAPKIALAGGKRFSAPVTVNDNRDVIGHRFDALIVGRDGKVYVVWLDKRDKAVAKQRGEEYAGAALYYAVSTDGGASLPPPLAFGDLAAQPGHADVLSLGREVLLVWKEFNGEASVIRMQATSDAGAGGREAAERGQRAHPNKHT